MQNFVYNTYIKNRKEGNMFDNLVCATNPNLGDLMAAAHLFGDAELLSNHEIEKLVVDGFAIAQKQIREMQGLDESPVKLVVAPRTATAATTARAAAPMLKQLGAEMYCAYVNRALQITQ